MPTKKISLEIQIRDFALLRSLFESRVMTGAHIATLYFEDKKEAAKKRLQKLKAAGLIAERKRRAYEQSVLFLTRKGFQVLTDQGVLTEYPSFSITSLERRASVSELTIRHELEVMDVKAAFHAAIRKTERFTVSEFTTWPLLNQFEVSRQGYGADILVKPDGFVRIHEKEDGAKGFIHDCFLEVDRSTETQEILVTRAACYLDHYKSGGFAVAQGATRSAYKEYPFRVLVVLKTAERRNNTALRLLQNIPPILTQVCLTTLDEVKSDSLGAIWTRPVDYRAIVKGTQFDTEQPRQTGHYRRQPEREALIENKIQKFALFA